MRDTLVEEPNSKFTDSENFLLQAIQKDPLYYCVMHFLKMIRETDSNKETFELRYDDGRFIHGILIESCKTIFGDKDVRAFSPLAGSDRETTLVELIKKLTDSKELIFFTYKNGKFTNQPSPIKAQIKKQKKESIIDFFNKVSEQIEKSLSKEELSSI